MRADQAAGAVLRERKQSHLDLCETGRVEYHAKTTLFEDVELLHCSIPELAVDEIDLGCELLGRPLRAPFLITGMTGGTEEAFAVNRDMAIVAERCGIAIGLGSQRVMQRDPSTAWTFDVRELAPSVPLLANIGLAQAAQQSTAEVQHLVESVRADALCVHLNPAQEIVQPEGDRDFRRGYETLRRLVAELPVPVIAKETGCGISRPVADRLVEVGVRYVDVSGAGGTSWVRVETLRGDARSLRLGELFGEWGVPTAASVAALRGSGLEVIASGGLRNGLEAAKAIALGARICGTALPVFRAYRSGGIDAAIELVSDMVEALRCAMLLTGSANLGQLARQPVVLGTRLRQWLEAARTGS